ncbi:MAG: LysR family transcriptional regulator [Planctomycetia bacterium]|nr:LysR family transcriptional regulator [Planctomycetia bacterium]
MTLQQLQYAVTIAEMGSINKAANELYVSQSALSCAMRDLEKEIHTTVFMRTNRGIIVTADGEVFLGYARQILEQYRLMEYKYLKTETRKHKFSVSMQHYTFAVQAFINTVKKYGADEFEFAVYETQTHTVIQNVKTLKSEIGVLYLNDFNRDVLNKIFYDSDVEYVPLFECPISVYLWREHPLAQYSSISMDDLASYPCLSFEQGVGNSFYYAEEVMSAYPYRQIIKTSDRATMLNLMVGLNGYTLCCGIICEELNGEYYCSVPLATQEKMTIGYIKKKQSALSNVGNEFISELKKFDPDLA